MEDIIPAHKNNNSTKSSVPSAGNVLRLQYKLPARLKKSLSSNDSPRRSSSKSTLLNQRSKTASSHHAAPPVRFKRRSLLTTVSSRPQYIKPPAALERHTSDVHQRPLSPVKLSPPPYLSRWQTSPGGKTKPRPRHPPLNLAGEVRDVPYNFTSSSRQSQPTRKLPSKTPPSSLLEDKTGSAMARARHVLPPSDSFHASLNRLRALSSTLRYLFHLPVNKHNFANLIILLSGCLLSYGLIWNLDGLSQGWRVMDGVQQRVLTAFTKISSASVAMAEINFTASEDEFLGAARLLQAAQADLDEAMSTSQNVWRYVDVTGTVKSGQELLRAGENLSAAGVYVSRGLGPLLDNFGQKTFVEAISYASEQFQLATDALLASEKSLNQIDSVIIPRDVKEQITKLKNIIPHVRSTLTNFTDQSDLLLAVLGTTRDQQYLLLFQNNHEIRPTGGFIGSIGLVNIDRGTVEQIDINSVYDSDGQMLDYIAPPEPLRPITNRWYLRDANWFINFPTSAAKIIQFFEKEGGPTVDGVVALTPAVIRSLLGVTGPIKVPSYNIEVNRDNFWRVTSDQVSYSYDKQLNRPKQFLADLAPLLLNRLFTAKATSSLKIFATLIAAIEQKQLMFYLNDDTLQQKLSVLGWSGEVPPRQSGLLGVNNANVAGHKSDQFIEQTIDYQLELLPDGSSVANVIIQREHRGNIEHSDYPYPADEDPSRKDNIVYQRVLVPLGSKLISATGFSSRADVPQMVIPSDTDLLTADKDLTTWQTGQFTHPSGTVIGEEAGYTFFANWLITKPGQTSVAHYRYKLPPSPRLPSLIDPVKRLEAYVMKQPGDTRTDLRVELKLPNNVRLVHFSPASGVTPRDNSSLTYRAPLRRDTLVGAVYER